MKYYYLTWYNYFDSGVLPFNFRVEYGERCSQSHSGEYDWLVPYPTRNIQGRYIPIFLVVMIIYKLLILVNSYLEELTRCRLEKWSSSDEPPNWPLISVFEWFSVTRLFMTVPLMNGTRERCSTHPHRESGGTDIYYLRNEWIWFSLYSREFPCMLV